MGSAIPSSHTMTLGEGGAEKKSGGEEKKEGKEYRVPDRVIPLKYIKITPNFSGNPK